MAIYSNAEFSLHSQTCPLHCATPLIYYLYSTMQVAGTLQT